MSIARLLVPVFALVVLLLPQITFAATGDFFGPIIPEECNCEKTESAADWGCVLAVIQNVMKFAVSIGVVIFILTAAYAGFLFMTSAFNPSSREKARSMLINTMVGFLIAISAWLLVDFIMKALYNPATLDGSGQRFGPWNSILVGNPDDKCIDIKKPPAVTGTGPKTPTTPGGVQGTPGGPSSTTTPTDGGGTGTHAIALSELSAASISIYSSGNCSDKTKSTCTSLDGIRANVIDQVVALKAACDSKTKAACTFIVTGGTETGHEPGTYSHANGYKIDLDDTATLNAYIQRSFASSGTRNGDPVYKDKCGNEYVHELSRGHWDITVNKGVCTDLPK